MIFLLTQGALSAPLEDLVVGLDLYPLPWFSGYLSVTKSVSFHYCFFESQKNEKKDPLILFTGRDIPLSVLRKAFLEQGPIILEEDIPKLNPFALNKQANLLYIQTVTGTGFSRGDARSTDDSQNSQDFLQALLSFYGKFPQMQRNDLFLLGQLYGGVGAVWLAQQIHEHNQRDAQQIKLRGLALFNPCLSDGDCNVAGLSQDSVLYLYKRGFLPEQDYNHFQEICAPFPLSIECQRLRASLLQQFALTNSSLHNLYAQQGEESTNWLNNQIVKNSMHIPVGTQWMPISAEADGNFTKGQAWSVLLKLVGRYKIWIVSQDLEGQVPTAATKQRVVQLRRQLKLDQLSPWREWCQGDQQAGFLWSLQDLTFVTIRGSGGILAGSKPEQRLKVVQSFTAEGQLPFC